jgi:hypothetical protein
LVEILMFCPGAFGFADDEPEDEDAPESDGVAPATHGDEASPTPTPSATAKAPTRPICLAYPAAVCFALLMCSFLHRCQGLQLWMSVGSDGSRKDRGVVKGVRAK